MNQSVKFSTSPPQVVPRRSKAPAYGGFWRCAADSESGLRPYIRQFGA